MDHATRAPGLRCASGQFIDLGYQVNLAASDAYALLQALRAEGARARVHLVNDIHRTPILVVDDAGRVVRVIQPR